MQIADTELQMTADLVNDFAPQSAPHEAFDALETMVFGNADIDDELAVWFSIVVLSLAARRASGELIDANRFTFETPWH